MGRLFGDLWMEAVWLGWKHRNESRMNEAMLRGAKATSEDPQNPHSHEAPSKEKKSHWFSNQSLEFT